MFANLFFHYEFLWAVYFFSVTNCDKTIKVYYLCCSETIKTTL